ncbi:pilus assembly protein N-terminal domain-containing protein [Candidatus Obscuribacterales bacterium]|nr:pilus assembly protein N-terminal domain-containing protein [Candidatus Obscuribacterales bacterium]
MSSRNYLHHLDCARLPLKAASFGLLLGVFSAENAVASPLIGAQEEPRATVSSKAVRLQEFEKKYILDLSVSQARLFRTKNNIVRTAIADPNIAEPVVVCETDLYIRGRKPGVTTLILWNELGATLLMEVRVENTPDFLSSNLTAAKTELDRRANFTDETVVSLADFPSIKLEEEFATKQVNCNLSVRRTPQLPPKPPHKAKGPREDVLQWGKSDKVTVRSNVRTDHYKTSRNVHLDVSQCRAFRVPDGINNIAVANTKVADPVVTEKREVILIGRSSGKTTMAIEDEVGNSEAWALTVSKHSNSMLPALHALRRFIVKNIFRVKPQSEFPYLSNEILTLAEIWPTKQIGAKTGQPRLFKTEHSITRTVVSDPDVAIPCVVSSTEIALIGRNEGRTSLFVWDDSGEVSAITVDIGKGTAPIVETKSDSEPSVFSKFPKGIWQVENWTGSRKDVVVVADTSDKCPTGTAQLLPVTLMRSIHLAKPRHSYRSIATMLNNQAVLRLKQHEIESAIITFQNAILYDTSYKKAFQNLSIAYNNLGMEQRAQPDLSLKHFRNSLYLDPTNQVTMKNFKIMMRMAGRDPNSFSDRVELGDIAFGQNDIAGSIVEYEAALKIKEDETVRQKLKASLEAAERSVHL